MNGLEQDDPCDMTVTTRIPEVHVHHFKNASAHMRHNFLIVYHEKDGELREDWFHGGTVIRVEIHRKGELHQQEG